MKTSSDDLDLAHRRLCPDGACIGVIGSDGKCRVCGRAADAAADADTDDDADWDAESESDSEAESGSETESDPESAFDPDRKLCPDGACIGLIGEDGRCNVCGNAAVGS